MLRKLKEIAIFLVSIIGIIINIDKIEITKARFSQSIVLNPPTLVIAHVSIYNLVVLALIILSVFSIIRMKEW